MVLDQRKVDWSPWVSGEPLAQVEELPFLGVLFTDEGIMEREFSRGGSVRRDAVAAPVGRGKDGAKWKGEAPNQPVHPGSDPHL